MGPERNGTTVPFFGAVSSVGKSTYFQFLDQSVQSQKDPAIASGGHLSGNL